MAVEMELARIVIHQTQNFHMIELRRVGQGAGQGEVRLPIVIGLAEAMAIERRVKGEHLPRPQTHDLLANVITALGAKLEKIEITDMQEGTFFANLVLSHDGQRIVVDTRPSDALALGAMQKTPIFVAESVLEQISDES